MLASDGTFSNTLYHNLTCYHESKHYFYRYGHASQKQWLYVQEIWGLEVVEPLSTYDMGNADLQGSITAKC
jgi:hypothetical protein